MKETRMTEDKIKEIISQMTLEEKAALLSGLDNQYTKGVERLGVPRIRMMDGPSKRSVEEINNVYMNKEVQNG
jgi:beta-glucosidase